jgi:hypothetical protein
MKLLLQLRLDLRLKLVHIHKQPDSYEEDDNGYCDNTEMIFSLRMGRLYARAYDVLEETLGEDFRAKSKSPRLSAGALTSGFRSWN